MIRNYYKIPRDKTLKTLREAKKDSWIYVNNPSGEELGFLAGRYNLDESLLRDSLDENEVPRLEVEDKIIYIYLRYPQNDQDSIATVPVLITIGQDFIATIGQNLEILLDIVRNSKNGAYSTQKVRLLLKLLTLINSQYYSYLYGIRKKVRSSSIRLEKIDNKDIIKFVNYENVLNDFLSALIPTNTIFNYLLSGKYLKLGQTYNDLVEDITLSNVENMEIAKSTMRTIVNIREGYSTIMTNNLNRVIKLFTSLTVMLTIPTMIASIYGMNVRLPFEEAPHVFDGIIVSIILILAILTYIFIKKDWL